MPFSAQTRGIPYTMQLDLSWPIVIPPMRAMALIPSSPTEPIPVIIIPMTAERNTCATETVVEFERRKFLIGGTASSLALLSELPQASKEEVATKYASTHEAEFSVRGVA